MNKLTQEGNEELNMGLNFAQLNFNRCGAAHDLMAQTVVKKRIDVIIGCEPNIKRECKQFCDINCDAFINVYSNLPVISYHEGSGFVCVELKCCVIFSCYCSPSRTIDEFNTLLYDIQRIMISYDKDILIGGDLNAKIIQMGSQKGDKRGDIFDLWLSSNGLVILNEGKVPTFSGSTGESIVDFTASSTNLSRKVKEWKVDDENENLSDHRTIFFTLRNPKTTPNLPSFAGRWMMSKRAMQKLSQEDQLFEEGEQRTPENLVKNVKRLCEKCVGRLKGNARQRVPVYWWNNEISEKRHECNKIRRQGTRYRKGCREENEETRGIREQHKKARKELRKLIKDSKREKWKNLCAELEEDVWGKAYKIVTRKLKLKPRLNIDDEKVEEQVKKLFPTQKEVKWDSSEEQIEVELFTEEELLGAASKLSKKKAPGPDGIMVEIINALLPRHKNIFLEIYNNCLSNGIFPKIWKQARLVLMEKPRKRDASVTYRPLCLLDTLGKLLESLLRERLQVEVETNSLLHQNQFGYRKGRSTVQAVERVQKIVDDIKKKALKNREVCALILLDIENAFNSASWKEIVKALTAGRVSAYLVQMIKGYLSERCIIAPNGIKYKVTCGVPQGSLLGPLLWNLFYDRILRLDWEEGTELFAYADDLALVVKAKTREQLEDKASYAVQSITSELTSMGLKIAAQKTEIVLLQGRRLVKSIKINVGTTEVESIRTVKYLGVFLNKDMSMTDHVMNVTKKAAIMTNLVMRLMPRLGGPKARSRRLIASAVISVILYAAPTWQRCLKYKRYRGLLTRTNRKIAIGIASAYRTVSAEAIEVITGLPPLDLLVNERCEIYKKGKEGKEECRARVLDEWQARWNTNTGWTRILIPNLQKWITRGWGETDYYLSQALTGHGVYGAYLYRIRKAEEDSCWFCGETDTPEHTFFECEEFNVQRSRCETRCGVRITKHNMVDQMLQSSDKWREIQEMVTSILKSKEDYEREREKKKKDMTQSAGTSDRSIIGGGRRLRGGLCPSPLPGR